MSANERAEGSSGEKKKTPWNLMSRKPWQCMNKQGKDNKRCSDSIDGV